MKNLKPMNEIRAKKLLQRWQTRLKIKIFLKSKRESISSNAKKPLSTNKKTQYHGKRIEFENFNQRKKREK